MKRDQLGQVSLDLLLLIAVLLLIVIHMIHSGG